jgi:hypothetical protein
MTAEIRETDWPSVGFVAVFDYRTHILNVLTESTMAPTQRGEVAAPDETLAEVVMA